MWFAPRSALAEPRRRRGYAIERESGGLSDAGAGPASSHMAASLGCYALLTLVVWGLFAFDRGFFQDELWVLVDARRAPRLLWLGDTWRIQPHRPLMGLPYLLAAWSPWPRAALQLLYGLTLFSSAVLLMGVARRLMPGSPLTAFVAGALSITASGDVSTNYVGAQIHWTATLFLAALYAALGARRRPTWARVGVSTALMAAGLWTAEMFLWPILTTPILIWGLEGFRVTPVVRRLGAVWYATLVPYLVVLGVFLTRDGGYAARVLERPGLGDWLHRSAWLLSLHFEPWAWAGLFDRRFPGCAASAVSRHWRLAFALLAAGLFAWTAARLARRGCGFSVALAGRAGDGAGAGEDASRARAQAWVAAWCAALLVAYAASFALVGTWHLAYRTQIAPRLFASLLVALATASLARRLGRLALCVPALFVAGGAWAGVASQDALLTIWRHQRRELSSIVEQAPGLSAGTWVMLENDLARCPLATSYAEVGGPWLRYLYRRPGLPVIVRSPASRTSCTVDPGGWTCGDSAGAPGSRRVPAERAVLFEFSADTGRYALVREVAGVPAYRPGARIDFRPPPREVLSLLSESEWLARLFPAGGRKVAGLPDPNLPDTAFQVEWGPCNVPASVAAGAAFEVSVEAVSGPK